MLQEQGVIMSPQYSFSLNGEHFRGSYSTREEALADAIAAARRCADSPQSVYVGRRVLADAKASGHARMVLTNMAARAREEFGDTGSAYLARLSKQQIESLDESLEQAILSWLEHNSLIPTFFKVEAIGQYPVPLSSSESNASDFREVQEIGTVTSDV
jgi:hypothetical protein